MVIRKIRGTYSKYLEEGQYTALAKKIYNSENATSNLKKIFSEGERAKFTYDTTTLDPLVKFLQDDFGYKKFDDFAGKNTDDFVREYANRRSIKEIRHLSLKQRREVDDWVIKRTEALFRSLNSHAQRAESISSLSYNKEKIEKKLDKIYKATKHNEKTILSTSLSNPDSLMGLYSEKEKLKYILTQYQNEIEECDIELKKNSQNRFAARRKRECIKRLSEVSSEIEKLSDEEDRQIHILNQQLEKVFLIKNIHANERLVKALKLITSGKLDQGIRLLNSVNRQKQFNDFKKKKKRFKNFNSELEAVGRCLAVEEYILAVETLKLYQRESCYDDASVYLARSLEYSSYVHNTVLYAEVLYLKGKKDAAKKLFLEILPKIKKEDYLELAQVKRGLASISKDDSHIEESLSYLHEARVPLEKLKRRDKKAAELIAVIYNDIGSIMRKLRNFKESKSYIQKSLDIGITLYGNVHQEIANRYNNLGLTYQYSGNNIKALSYFRKAFAVYKKIFGKHDRSVAAIMSNVGLSYIDLGEYEAAIDFFTAAINLFLSILPKEDLQLAIVYSNLGMALLHKGDFKAADANFSKSISIKKKIFGEQGAAIMREYLAYGHSYYIIKQYKNAKPYFEKAIDLMNIFHGNNDSIADNFYRLYSKCFD